MISDNSEQLVDCWPDEAELEKLSPMMKLYISTRKQYPDCLLFYRLGDFYELFFNDAVTASRELELALTGKACGLERRAPMCGVPFHAVDTYISRLVEKGYRVAICEQVEDPKQAKGLVKRAVIRIVTPGTNLDQGAMDDSKNNYLCSIFCVNQEGKDVFGVSYVDISTGDFYVTELESAKLVTDEIDKLEPKELLCCPEIELYGIALSELKHRHDFVVTSLSNAYFDTDDAAKELTAHFHKKSVLELGLAGYSSGISCAGAILRYLHETQMNELGNIDELVTYKSGKYMILDSATRRNLELTENMHDAGKKNTLLWVLDKTKTAMGARLLRNTVLQPLIDSKEINDRLDAIEELNKNMVTREEIREYLSRIHDLERIMVKISYKSANARDLLSFGTSIKMLPDIILQAKELKGDRLSKLAEEIDSLSDLENMISQSINEDAPLVIREGNLIKAGFDSTVDELRSARTNGKEWLAKLEEDQRNLTGIKGLKVKFNNVFGYYLEVTNSYKNLVPESWERKQTTVNSERYTIPELKEIENKILTAQDRLNEIEYEIFSSVRDKIAENSMRIQKTAKALAALDVYCSLSYVAEHFNYVRPVFNNKGYLSIKGGRHPVIEKVIKREGFIPNDLTLNDSEDRVAIITGPNMAGKSTYMRQCALIVIMAQLGSFIPADSADLCIVDRVFTRVGASDDLASGRSTFMVEMSEVANILKNATRNSLLILDEIGRGTSTFDGLAIAWAVTEYILKKNRIGAKTLFATHYHELTELEGKLPGIKNYNIAVRENGKDIVFLRKIVKGGADKSYGIQVARLAGLPEEVLERASELVEQLSCSDLADNARIISEAAGIKENKKGQKSEKPCFDGQFSLFSANGAENAGNAAGAGNSENVLEESVSVSVNSTEREVLEELKMLDVDNLRGVEAIQILDELKQKLKTV